MTSKGFEIVVRSLLVACLSLLISLPVAAQEDTNKEIDVKEIVFDHIFDSYEWHITEWGDHPVAIPLPVIVKAEESGWHLFLSSKLHNGHVYQGLYIASEGEYKGKIVEKNSQGVEIRPLDISITKNTFSLLLSSFVLIVIMLSVTRFYKSNKPKKAPGGFIGMMEVVILTIYEDVVIK
ncbi:MAG: F0F1 ATP synthase subunit A, partial [Bacteroidales bacterium]|nr:F0F1 ATP synthase subunit A [Bacteroidales bacterium]